METTLRIPLDNRTAELYAAAPVETRETLQVLLNIWLRDLVSSPRSLQSIMDEVSENAHARFDPRDS